MLNTRQNQQQNIIPVLGIDFKFFYVSEVAAMLRFPYFISLNIIKKFCFNNTL
jgi:hypothetical protein